MSPRLTVNVCAAFLLAGGLGGCIADDGVKAPGKIELGVLTCRLGAVENLLVYAEESFACGFEGRGRSSAYDGKIRKIGANLELKGDQTLRWLVLAPATYDRAGSLAGTYAGASAEAGAVIGAGAKLLIGGSDEAITLQPLSVSTSTDAVGLSLTLDALVLEYRGPAA